MDGKDLGVEPAMPADEKRDHGFSTVHHLGLTKRELFAAYAMQGYRAASNSSPLSSGYVAERAVDDADALLNALAKEL